jgi:hypothetical protein
MGAAIAGIPKHGMKKVSAPFTLQLAAVNAKSQPAQKVSTSNKANSSFTSIFTSTKRHPIAKVCLRSMAISYLNI